VLRADSGLMQEGWRAFIVNDRVDVAIASMPMVSISAK